MRNSFIRIILVFSVWRIALFILAFLSPFIINQFGAKFPYFQLLILTGMPQWIWGFANFDGVHYLNIIQMGYQLNYSQAFFPLYPLVIIAFDFLHNPLITGLILSNLFILLALFIIYKLFKLDYGEDIAFKSIILLLSFPTAFYFGALYTESLFVLLSVLTIYFARKEKFFFAAIFASLAAATKVIGVLLVVFLLVELLIQNNYKLTVLLQRRWKSLLSVCCIAPLGLLVYMIYLYIMFNDPIYFLNAQAAFGANRSNEPFILFPQVIYRYLKIFATVPVSTLPFFNALIEFLFTVIPFALLIILVKKIRMSILVLVGLSLIIPTLTGTLLSMPRYVLLIFLVFPIIVIKMEKKVYYLIFFFGLLQALLLSLFIRGYWVA